MGGMFGAALGLGLAWAMVTRGNWNPVVTLGLVVLVLFLVYRAGKRSAAGSAVAAASAVASASAESQAVATGGAAQAGVQVFIGDGTGVRWRDLSGAPFLVPEGDRATLSPADRLELAHVQAVRELDDPDLAEDVDPVDLVDMIESGSRPVRQQTVDGCDSQR